MSITAFAKFWQTDLTRECFLDYLTKDDLRRMRLVSQDFSFTISPVLFRQITVDFNATSFSRQARLAALGRIGHHVKTFCFSMPHTEETFLPPLLNPDTLEELTFQYEPQVYTSRPLSLGSMAPKYGSWELNDLLVRQYPLLFHAATNTSSFVQALEALPHLRHLKVSCPGQNTNQRHRRDIVDYALISLRIAVEQCNPEHLKSITLDPIHPSATFYLRPQISLGSLPSSTRIWRRIQNLNIGMKSFETSGPDSTTDHLKTLHTYLSSFISLEKLSFKWLGDLKGPSPLSLSTEPCTSRPSSLDYSTCISHDKRSSTASKGFSSLRPLHFRHLKYMHLENAIFDACQASTFITTHRKTLRDFNFAHCHLRSGTWDDALSPLTHISGNEDWKTKQYNTSTCKPPSPHASRTSPTPPKSPPVTLNEIHTVPIMLSPDTSFPASSTELVKDRLWQDKEMKFFDLDSDKHSLLSSWSKRRRGRGGGGIDALRRLGAKVGIPYVVRDSDIAMESVRTLLKGCRVAWH